MPKLWSNTQGNKRILFLPESTQNKNKLFLLFYQEVYSNRISTEPKPPGEFLPEQRGEVRDRCGCYEHSKNIKLLTWQDQRIVKDVISQSDQRAIILKT